MARSLSAPPAASPPRTRPHDPFAARRGAARQASGGVAAGRGGALVSATRAGLTLLPRGSAFPAHGLDWARARVLWAGALLGAADACLLARLPRDGARGCPLLARIVRLVGAA